MKIDKWKKVQAEQGMIVVLCAGVWGTRGQIRQDKVGLGGLVAWLINFPDNRCCPMYRSTLKSA